MSSACVQSGNTFYRFNGIEPASFESQLFDQQWLRDNNLISQESSQGRGMTAHLSFDEHSLVLRRYCRGGLIRHLTKDRFVWTGLSRTRPFAEFDLLVEMTRLGLPSPRPYACEVEQMGLFYRGALIMHEIPRTATLAETLGQREVTETEWLAVGTCLRRFHDASVYHSDLNANNVLLNDNGEVFLIDFDKSRIRKGSGGHWKSANLKRLQRSILKCQRKSDAFFFRPAQWETLGRGYLLAGSPSHRSNRSA